MDGVLNHFLPSVLYCRIMHIQSLKFSRDDIPLDPAEAPPVFAHRHQFPLGSPAFPLFLFYKKTIGAFSVCGLKVWNSLPTAVCNVDSYPAFRRVFKSHLLSCAFSSSLLSHLFTDIVSYSQPCYCRLAMFIVLYFI